MPARPPFPALAAEAVTCLRFYTRLPLPALAVEAAHPPDPFARCLAWAPLAGAAVGLFGAAALAGAAALGLPPAVGAALAVLSTVLASGGLHEDGLADCADGFGGGGTRERKLEIMRDSRLGTYGALAVGFSLLLRTAALAALGERGGPGLAAAGLVTAAAASRGIGLMPMALLAPARADGLGHGAGRLPASVFPAAAAGALALGLALPLSAGVPPLRAALALGAATLAAAGVTRLARGQIGGVTGDVAGCCQQCCEVALLLGLLIAPGAG
ncbi:adenosylcobinamide-GDP ribazoletransferase [Lichenibacterium dinghuense]|uniref:adenosylcobinamide-GDP ribazoletransferase n=1 Tax=Lichenibacterium dinghuense TaxID=2895977 RepID=UPI001F025B86|nr:adenosylcobinamide-GDP ribazoletransferase [Lichenibacterium sp. 6Y81]